MTEPSELRDGPRDRQTTVNGRERIVSAGNTLVPVILALRSRGFEVRREEREGGEWWRAESDDLELISEDPVTLLGLAAMRETRGPNWTASDQEIEAVIAEFRLGPNPG